MIRTENRNVESTFLRLVRRYGFPVLSLVFGLAALVVILAPTVTSTPPYIVGENLVLAEVQVLPGFYMKPITFFQYSFFLCFGFALYAPHVRAWFMRVRPGILRTVYLVAWLIALGSGFEVMYHIVLWSASLAAEGFTNPDTVVNPWPRNPYPLNIVYAAKIVVLIFAMALFLIDYINRVDRARTTRQTIEAARDGLGDRRIRV
jgi:hypothetical protein